LPGRVQLENLETLTANHHAAKHRPSACSVSDTVNPHSSVAPAAAVPPRAGPQLQAGYAQQPQAEQHQRRGFGHRRHLEDRAQACADLDADSRCGRKLIKIGAKVVRYAKAVTFQPAEVALPRALFAAILGRIGRLRAAPSPG
jgi:hypothetical protein